MGPKCNNKHPYERHTKKGKDPVKMKAENGVRQQQAKNNPEAPETEKSREKILPKAL